MFTWLLCFNMLLMHSHLQPDQLFTQYFPFILKSCYLAEWKKTVKWFNSSSSAVFIIYSDLSDMLSLHWLYWVSDHNPQSMALAYNTWLRVLEGKLLRTEEHVKACAGWGHCLMKWCSCKKLIKRTWCCCVGGHMDCIVNGEIFRIL